VKRLHVHVAVSDLQESVGFYSTMFGAPPSVLKDDYAKWMLDDPRVNFAISSRRRAPGLDHLGIQAEVGAELTEISGRLKAAGAETIDEAATTCCYAQSDKTWVQDPAGIRWETFHTLGESTVYGEDLEDAAVTGEACCAPAAPKAAACCAPEPAPAKTTSCCGPAA
jgi:hypothetical protein